MRRVVRALAALVAAAPVLLAAPVAAQATPGPPNAPEYWFDTWRVPSLWTSGARGQGITIGEIDTGVAKIPELDGRVLAGHNFGGAGGNGRTDHEIDGFGHGTAMASIMVARPGLFNITGLAPDAKVLPIAVPLNGTTDAGEPDHLSDAITYAADHGAKIINMSLGGIRQSGLDDTACTSDEQDAIYDALAKGAIVVASIGNSGPTRNAIEDPAVCLGVVSVGAVDASGQVADFSTRQPYLTLVAPGVGIPSLGRIAGQAYSGDGTSQAAALTSATLALVWSKYPKDTGRQIVSRVLATLDSHRSTPSSSYGYGLLDAYRAVTASVPADAPNPVYDGAEPFRDRDKALAAQSRTKPPAAARVSAGGTGSYSVGSTPRLSTPQVELGAGVAAAGLLLLLALLVATVVRRRRAAAQPAFAGPGFAGPGFAGPGFGGPGFAGPGFAGPGSAGPGFPAPGFPAPGQPSPGYPPSGPAPAGPAPAGRAPGYPSAGYPPPGQPPPGAAQPGYPPPSYPPPPYPPPTYPAHPAYPAQAYPPPAVPAPDYPPPQTAPPLTAEPAEPAPRPRPRPYTDAPSVPPAPPPAAPPERGPSTD